MPRLKPQGIYGNIAKGSLPPILAFSKSVSCPEMANGAIPTFDLRGVHTCYLKPCHCLHSLIRWMKRIRPQNVPSRWCLTLALTCRRKRERSGRWRQLAGRRGRGRLGQRHSGRMWLRSPIVTGVPASYVLWPVEDRLHQDHTALVAVAVARVYDGGHCLAHDEVIQGRTPGQARCALSPGAPPSPPRRGL